MDSVVKLKTVEQPTQEAPNNIEAEQGLLGAILNNNEYLNRVADFLLPEHFYMPLHRKIYENIIKFSERGMIANPITLKALIQGEESLKNSEISSFDYLVRISANATTVVNVESFARIIYDNSIRRSLIDIGNIIVSNSYRESGDLDAQTQIEIAEQKLFNLASNGVADNKVSSIKDSFKSMLAKLDITMKRGEKISGVPTGFIDLDALLGGLQNSDLLILAARPSMGKTALAVNILVNAAEGFLKQKQQQSLDKPKSAAIFSLEMSSEQLVTRMLSIKTKVNSSKIRLGNINKQEFETISRESGKLNQLPIFIDDTPALSISAMRTRARRLKRQHNLGLLIVDYLQLLTSTKASDNRVNEIGDISQGLKAIAKELDIPVIALSQLSRAVESREDKRPQLSDLRESGNIEQDADVVMFIYREEYYLERKKNGHEGDNDKFVAWQREMEQVKNLANVIISKQRNGPIGVATLRFDSETTTFSNLELHLAKA